MDSGNKYIAFALVIIVAFILQVALVMIDQKETPAGAAIEFAKAYYKLDQSMADQLCRAIIENDEEIDVVDDFLQRAAETAADGRPANGWTHSPSSSGFADLDSVVPRHGEVKKPVLLLAFVDHQSPLEAVGLGDPGASQEDHDRHVRDHEGPPAFPERKRG